MKNLSIKRWSGEGDRKQLVQEVKNSEKEEPVFALPVNGRAAAAARAASGSVSGSASATLPASGPAAPSPLESAAAAKGGKKVCLTPPAWPHEIFELHKMFR